MPVRPHAKKHHVQYGLCPKHARYHTGVPACRLLRAELAAASQADASVPQESILSGLSVEELGEGVDRGEHLTRMAVAKARLLEPLSRIKVAVDHDALDAITGKDYGDSLTNWEGWWGQNKEKSDAELAFPERGPNGQLALPAHPPTEQQDGQVRRRESSSTAGCHRC